MAYRDVFDRYKPKMVFWEFLVLTRKLMIIGLALIISSTYIQSYVAFVGMACFLQLHDRFRPAEDPDINILELLSMYTITLVIYSGLYFIQDTASPVASNIMLILDAIFGAIFFLYTLRYLYRIFWKKIPAIRVPSRQSPLKITKQNKPNKQIFRKQNHGGNLDFTTMTNPISSTANTEAPLAPREKEILTTIFSGKNPRPYGRYYNRSHLHWKRLNPIPITQLEALNLEANLSPRSPKSLTSFFGRRYSFQEGSMWNADNSISKRKSMDIIKINETEGQSDRLLTTEKLITSPGAEDVPEETVLIGRITPRTQRPVFFEKARKWK